MRVIFNLLVRVVQKIPKHYHLSLLSIHETHKEKARSCSQRRHAFQIQNLEAPYLELTWKTLQRVFMVSEETILLLSYGAFKLQKCPAQHDEPKGVVVAHIADRNQELSNYTEDTSNKKDTAPDTGNLATYSELLKSWVLEKNL